MPKTHNSHLNAVKAGVATLAASAALAASSLAANADERPNILLLLGDDATMSDFGFVGSEMQTPNIDSLASKGAVFSRFHAAPVCSVTRAMLLTGTDPTENGLGTFDYAVYPEVEGVEGYETYLTRNSVTVQQRLQNAGYFTMMVGKWHLGGKAPGGEGPSEWGFDRSYGMLSGGSNHWNDYISLPNMLDESHVEMVQDGIIPRKKYYENGKRSNGPTGFFRMICGRASCSNT